MTFDNPTQLHIGLSATLGGKAYRIVGRSVLGEAEGGDVYYWNEYHLQASSGESAILVYDESEQTSQWRLFTSFEPEYHLPAAEAATKRVGDQLNLTGENVRVSFRGSSRVYFIDGLPPEGEAIGTLAEYFNAQAGANMLVVSWTGEEVDYYQGTDLSRGLVTSAFGLKDAAGLGERPHPATYSDESDDGDDSDGSSNAWKYILYAVLGVVLCLILFGHGCVFSSQYETKPVPKLVAPVRPLQLDATGTLFNKQCKLTGHIYMDVAEVGAHWERHEYELTTDDNTKFLLVCGETPGDPHWTFYEPLAPANAPTAFEAAKMKLGQTIDLDGFRGTVASIALFTVTQTDGAMMAKLGNGTVDYGLTATNQYRTLLARWDAYGIQYYSGQTIPAKQAQADFGVK